MRSVLCGTAVVLGLGLGLGDANAQTPGERLRLQLEAGRAAEAAQALSTRNGDEQRHAQGIAEFTVAIERLLQGLHRHGLVTPSNPFLPVLRLPVPPNAKPEPLDYNKLRAVYQTFLDDLARARTTLAAVRPHTGKIVLDLNAIKLTLAPGVQIQLAQVSAAMRNPMLRQPNAPVNEAWEVAFDYSDSLWLQGYTHVLGAMFEFIMAHDWGVTYEATAHLFFTGAKRPPELVEAPGGMAEQMMGPQAAGFADQLALVHLIHWPAGDKARMGRVRQHFKSMTALSRETWKAVRAESDDDREWLPSPRQSSRAVPSMPVTEEQVAGWLVLLDEFDAILDGKKLIPHWRFAKGINLRKVFEEPKQFDLVLWLTGHAATPFLESGPTIGAGDWARLTGMFRGGFLGYAVFFN